MPPASSLSSLAALLYLSPWEQQSHIHSFTWISPDNQNMTWQPVSIIAEWNHTGLGWSIEVVKRWINYNGSVIIIRGGSLYCIRTPVGGCKMVGYFYYTKHNQQKCDLESFYCNTSFNIILTSHSSCPSPLNTFQAEWNVPFLTGSWPLCALTSVVY